MALIINFVKQTTSTENVCISYCFAGENSVERGGGGWVHTLDANIFSFAYVSGFQEKVMPKQ